MASEEWFYLIMGEEVGPVSSADLKQLAQQGDVRSDTHVRKGRDGAWTVADQVRGLIEQRPTPPQPASPTRRNLQSSVEIAERFDLKREPSSQRYRYLNSLIVVNWVVGLLVIAVGLMAFLVQLVVGPSPDEFITSFLILLAFVGVAGSLFLTAELIRLFLAVEMNTRTSNDLLRAVLSGLDNIANK